jgi:succinoglycan biosynthesis protein ExoU
MPQHRTDRCVSDNIKQAGPQLACVDVLIAARDRADTIERAVSSALAERAVRAIIVVDDGSIDDTAVRARQCDREGKRVIVERLRFSRGPSAARNVALEISTASWIAILDGDDFFLPGRIGTLLSYSNDYDFVADDLIHIQEGRVKDEPPAPVQKDAAVKARRLTFEQFVLGNVTGRGSHRKELGYLQPLIRRQFLDLHALRYDETLRFGEDYVLYARALAAGARFLFIPTPGYVAVKRADSLSERHSRQDLEALGASDRALMAMNHLTQNERGAVTKHHADIERRTQWLVIVEALQSHNYPQFLSTFFRSPALTWYLAGRLIAEFPLQIRRRLERPSRS